MVGTFCCAYGCAFRAHRKSKKQIAYELDTGEKIRIYKFPKDPQRKNKWQQAVRRVGFVVKESTVICSRHFTDDCFYRLGPQVRLTREAIPSIFPSFPSHLLKPKRVRRKIVYNCPPQPILMEVAEPLTLAQPMPTTDNSDGLSNENRRPLSKSPTKAALRSKICELKKKFRLKVKTLQQKCRRKSKKIRDLKNVIKELLKKNLISQELAMSLEGIGGGCQSLIERSINKNKGKTIPKVYDPKIRAFALTLHYYSPKAYNYVRSQFNTCLPHTKTIYKWYQAVDGEAGFTSESFLALKQKESSSGYKIFYSLMLDEMSIKIHEGLYGSKRRGLVDFGTGENSNEKAKDVLVLMLVAINGSWKLPVGYFLTAGVNGEQRAALVKTCLTKSAEVRAEVVSLTFDGAPSNFAMAKVLGCSLETPTLTHFNHPVTNSPVYIFPDPCHMIKLVRNTFGDKKLIWENDSRIDWHYIELLNDLQEEEGLRMGNRLTPLHLHFHRQKMKVRLATQLLSKSVADAMEMCRDMGLQQFNECTATVKFIRTFDQLFDIFNSKSLRQLGLKKPLHHSNYEAIFQILNEIERYILSLRCSANGEPLLVSQRKIGFLGFIISMKSLRSLYNNLCVGEKAPLLYLPTYKLSQDHLELFFSNIRSRNGYNNNPTATQFIASYKKVLLHTELSSDRSGNCIPLEQLTILTTSSKSIINMTTRIDDEELEVLGDFSDDKADHNYADIHLPSNLTLFSECIVEYIAGFVARRLAQILSCAFCISTLIDHSAKTRVVINKKDNGGLITPTQGVVTLCLKAEKVFRTCVHGSDGKTLSTLFTTIKMTSMVIKQFIGEIPVFPELHDHAVDQELLYDHRVHLMKAIVNKYLTIRVHHYLKNTVSSVGSKRQYYNHLTCFSGF